MQTTLLGLAIAFIIALVAALIGPYVIDWNQFRPQFEAEASRILGVSVRVTGALDARLLPSPSLSLREVDIGGANDSSKLSAAKLHIEFNLGSLLRGEVRATELTVNGARLDLGLDPQGRIDWPASSGGYNFGALAIDRVNLTGQIALYDAASRGRLELNDVAFSGDVRALAGSIRGDGNFTLSGTRYPFRVSSGPGAANSGARVHLTIEAAEIPLSIDLDGLLRFEARAPRFEGALLLTRPAPPQASDAGSAPTPWRVAAKLKADPAAAALNQIEVSYGAEETALKLAGSAAVRFGAMPLLQATLTAKSLDADRVLGSDLTPERLLSNLRAVVAGLPGLPLPAQIALSADQIILGGKPLQNVVADLRTERQAWRVDKLEARAPGQTNLVLSGAFASSVEAGFDGAVALDSAEPDLFVAWLQGRSDIAGRGQKPLRLRGNLGLAADRISLEAMSGEIDGSAVEGRIALMFAATGRSRAEVRIKADRLDFDAVGALVKSLAGPDAGWPDEGRLSLDIKRAVSAGQEMRPFGVDLNYGPDAIALDRLRVGEASGVMLDGAGAFNRKSATGKLTLAAAAPSLEQAARLIEPLSSDVSKRLLAMSGSPGPVRVKLALDVDKHATQVDRANLGAAFTIEGPQLAGTTTVKATPLLAAMRALDFDQVRKSDFAIEAHLVSPHGALIALLGLEQAVAAPDDAVRLDATLNGAWPSPLRLAAKLSGAPIDADLQGSVEPFAEPRKAALNLTIRRANLAPMLGLKPNDPRAQVATLSSRLSVNGDRYSFDDLDGVIASARLRGKIALTTTEPRTIEGEVGLDSLELAPLFNLAIGSAANPAEPLGRGLVQGWRGRLAFKAVRGELPGGAELRPISGVVRSDGQSLTFGGIRGSIGGGEILADIDARPGLQGLVLNAQLQMSNVEGASLRYRTLALPGRASMKMTATSQGRSAEALSGALSGDGLLTLADAKIPGLDPRAFEIAIRASDEGRASDESKLRRIVDSALSGGALSVASAQIGFVIKDGSLRVGVTTLEGEGARAVVSGGYDIAADQADIRATLSSTTIGGANSRPEIRFFAAGPPDALNKDVDVASFSTWLALRAVDRETRRLDQMQREAVPPAAAIPLTVPPATPRPSGAPASDSPLVPSRQAPAIIPPPRAPPRPRMRPRIVAPKPATPQTAPSPSVHVAPLPPAIDVRPAPGSVQRSGPRVRGPLVLTPQP